MQRDPMEAAGDAIREQFDRLTFELSDARMEIATLRDAIGNILAHVGHLDPDPERQTPYEQALIAARAALEKAKQP